MFHVVIPARLASTRLPEKVLAPIGGYPMLYWVWKRAMESQARSVVIATDHPRIAEVMTEYGAQVVMTRADHPSGTDRLAEVVDLCAWDDDTIVVNLQGDEPMMPVANLEQVAATLEQHAEAGIATVSEPIASEADFANPDIVKVVTQSNGRALYFSRARIPFPRSGQRVSPGDPDASLLTNTVRRHVGLYAYRCGFLRRFVTWPPAPIEQLESLEQLRALYFGETIQVVPAAAPVPAGVDTAADLEVVRGLMGSA